MNKLTEIISKFESIYPVESDVRDKRAILAKGKCEFCGGIGNQLHHTVEGKLRRKTFERVLTTRWICENCHIGSKKADMIKRFRSELNKELSKHFTNEEIISITGHNKLYGVQDVL